MKLIWISNNILFMLLSFRYVLADRDRDEGLEGFSTVRKGILEKTFTVQFNGTEELAKQCLESQGFKFEKKIAGNIYRVTKEGISPVKSIDDMAQQLMNSPGKLCTSVLNLWRETIEDRATRSAIPERSKRQTLDDAQWNEQWYLLSHLGYDVFTDTTNPTPDPSTDSHGTSCAGIIAAEDNTECVIGIAYGSKIGGVRLIASTGATTSQEAEALVYKKDEIDIYSNSWGAPDDGQTIAPISTIQEQALIDGTTNGRNGLGAIYSWAAGNGGYEDDDCNYDGYANSPYTIAVTSLQTSSAPADYSEPCSALMCATYGGDYNDDFIATTDVSNGCTTTFVGTSAACPVASGIFALVLESKPSLTWRDIQHIIVETANNDLHSSHDFYLNGAQKKVSTTAGFGLLDADAMITKAASWTTVPERLSCESQQGIVNSAAAVEILNTITISECAINYLEHVEITAQISTNITGHMELYLMSPNGAGWTRILKHRNEDTSSGTLVNHRFMSVHQWREGANGDWTIKLSDSNGGHVLIFYDWKIKLYGTSTDPLATKEDDNVNVGAIVGGVVGGVAVVGGVVAVVGYVVMGNKATASVAPTTS
ncbi:neuroendocrine convertase 1-like isoform X2 [Mya arenaria]|uniref:neuroendocrine convertase 1-like isoform X2 n=1 Tax=Mya arenaria TaxID=6604 RepID=UPI0022E65217|nr:neuroendocrine convertase 1-like isoform X2 [Mya arenaria]